jgi:hypothetical protein
MAEPPEEDPPRPWGEGNTPAPAAPPAGSSGRTVVVPPDSSMAAAAEQFNCPNCGGSIEVKAAGYTVSIACQYCGSVLDVTNPDVQIIQRYEEEVRKLELPLGSRGVLRGTEWEVIGYLRRSELGAYPFDEYLLFNPYEGYRWLDTDGRGWSLGNQLVASPQQNGLVGFQVDGEFYEPFYAQTPTQVDYVLGEFYWRVAVGEEVVAADFVRPGKMLSWERNDRESVWTLSELFEPHEITDAFGIDPPSGGGLPMPHQPSPYRKKAGLFLKIALAAGFALLVVTSLFGGTSDPQTATINLATNGVEQSAKIGPITLERARQAVTVSVRAPGIENSWVDLGYSLTNTETGEVYEADNVVEAYSGRDSEGSWSEGSRSSSSKFSMVPAGTYQLDIYAAGTQWRESGYSSSSGAQVEVTIQRGATFYSNLFLALLVIFAPALWQWWKHLSFESRRKSDSDFSGGDDDDD